MLPCKSQRPGTNSKVSAQAHKLSNTIVSFANHISNKCVPAAAKIFRAKVICYTVHRFSTLVT